MYIWLALRLPFFKLEAQAVNVEQQACIVASARKKVCAATPACLREGVVIDMPVSTAQALMNCDVLTRSDAQESLFLQRICDVLYVFTPYIQPYCPNVKDEYCDQGLLLELSRCTRLFGGIERLLSKICSALMEFGVCFEWALSKSAKAAWLLSAVGEKGKSERDVLDISTCDLDEFPQEANTLHDMGFLTLNDVKRQLEKEGGFAFQKRFNTAFVQYLFDILSIDVEEENAQASGAYSPGIHPLNSQEDFFSLPDSTLIPKAVIPAVVYQPEERYHDSVVFDFPLTSLEMLHEPMQYLLKNLSDYLVTKQKQCNGVQWRFSDIYHHQEILDVRCELIYRDWQLLHELSLIKLEQSGLPFEVDQLELVNPVLSDAAFNTGELSIASSQVTCVDSRVLQRVVTKIQARLGESNVFKVSYKDDHFPECAQRRIGVEQRADQELENEHRYAIRPGWILNTPITIGKNQNDLSWNGSIELIRGPERLEGHWWDKPTARDYFVAVREDQVRLWVFNDLFREEWFVQGVF